MRIDWCLVITYHIKLKSGISVVSFLWFVPKKPTLPASDSEGEMWGEHCWFCSVMCLCCIGSLWQRLDHVKCGIISVQCHSWRISISDNTFLLLIMKRSAKIIVYKIMCIDVYVKQYEIRHCRTLNYILELILGDLYRYLFVFRCFVEQLTKRRLALSPIFAFATKQRNKKEYRS